MQSGIQRNVSPHTFKIILQQIAINEQGFAIDIQSDTINKLKESATIRC